MGGEDNTMRNVGIGVLFLLVVAAGGGFFFYNRNKKLAEKKSMASKTDAGTEVIADTKTDSAPVTAQPVTSTAVTTPPVTSAAPPASEVQLSDYVSNAAVKKKLSGKYLPAVDLIPNGVPYDKATKEQQYAYNIYAGKVKELFGEKKDSTGLDWQGSWVNGFMKGMNLAYRPDYVAIFKPYITEYLNSDAKMPHWDVKTVGEFIKS